MRIYPLQENESSSYLDNYHLIIATIIVCSHEKKIYRRLWNRSATTRQEGRKFYASLKKQEPRRFSRIFGTLADRRFGNTSLVGIFAKSGRTLSIDVDKPVPRDFKYTKLRRAYRSAVFARHLVTTENYSSYMWKEMYHGRKWFILNS